MISNSFDNIVIYENDPEGLIIPYRLVSRTDREVIEAKYMRLRKASYGYIVRLGISSKRQNDY